MTHPTFTFAVNGFTTMFGTQEREGLLAVLRRGVVKEG